MAAHAKFSQYISILKIETPQSLSSFLLAVTYELFTNTIIAITKGICIIIPYSLKGNKHEKNYWGYFSAGKIISSSILAETAQPRSAIPLELRVFLGIFKNFGFLISNQSILLKNKPEFWRLIPNSAKIKKSLVFS